MIPINQAVVISEQVHSQLYLCRGRGTCDGLCIVPLSTSKLIPSLPWALPAFLASFGCSTVTLFAVWSTASKSSALREDLQVDMLRGRVRFRVNAVPSGEFGELHRQVSCQINY